MKNERHRKMLHMLKQHPIMFYSILKLVYFLDMVPMRVNSSRTGISLSGFAGKFLHTASLLVQGKEPADSIALHCNHGSLEVVDGLPPA